MPVRDLSGFAEAVVDHHDRVAAAQGESVQRQSRLAWAESHAAHLTGLASGVGEAEVAEADDREPPQARLGIPN